MEEIVRLEWKESYSIGVKEVDEQHKHLFELTQSLFDLLMKHPDDYVTGIRPILKELAEYTNYHFKCEENDYFCKYDYPSSDLHIMQHNNFINLVTKRIEDLPTTSLKDGVSLYAYLTKWLLSHIALADRAWAAFVLPKLAKEKLIKDTK